MAQLLMKEGLRSVSTMPGAPYVIEDGIRQMLMWCASNLDTNLEVHPVCLAKLGLYDQNPGIGTGVMSVNW